MTDASAGLTEPPFDPYLHDPAHWGVSLAHMAGLMLPCLELAQVRSVAEVGAFAGDLTRVLIAWAASSGVEVLAIDPAPQPGLVALADEHPALKLIRETSLQALEHLPLPDAIVIDGDHNYHVVSRELALIARRAADAPLPLILLHDVCWPHARRDDYFSVELIPESGRHPVAGGQGGITPGEAWLVPGGLPYPRSGAHEGGPRNGVLTAVEDFVATHDDLHFALIPAFFGFGIIWPDSATWSTPLGELLAPYDRNPIMTELEANRVYQLAQGHAYLAELWEARARLSRQQALLQRLLDSSAFSVAERLSRLRDKAGVATDQSIVSKDEIRGVLDA
jgi:hypothetical protein